MGVGQVWWRKNQENKKKKKKKKRMDVIKIGKII